MLTTFFARCGLNLHCSKSYSSGRGLSRYQVTVDCWYPRLMKGTFCHFLKMEYITFLLVQGCTKSKFLKIVFVFKSDTAAHSSSTFFLPNLVIFNCFSLFVCLFFLLFVFFFAGHFLDFILVGKVFGKTFRM